MRHIDRETVQRILDAADIVEVVSDFVTLKRRGANYIGLCPFHNERTPSFSVSKSKGICKCFSCGEGGSPVNFIMKIEQLSYYEALRYLARKYNIEIQEREMTPEERREEDDRESMLAINDFAMKHFEHNLLDTQAGHDIGLAYFRERGINDLMIKRFHLGYALEERDALLKDALSKGYSEKYLLETGLCSRTEQGRLYDRFRGRVIYPVFSLSGKVVAFGGRTLRSDKSMAKYVNSPESIIYSKRRELYGLYQAKQAINKHDKCILVEGYMDVISMHQSGIENVVASSGTSLTHEQAHLIHRFTRNITVIYDSDAAGIKASLRGIDILLAEGLSVKVLSLPDGDDPDSYAQSHSSGEVEDYIAKNETDFIRFKTRILLEGLENDPIARARAITDIVRSISVIPDDIARQVYIQECSRMMSIDDGVLTLQVAKFRNESLAKENEQRQREEQTRALHQDPSTAPTAPRDETQPSAPALAMAQEAAMASYMRGYEKEVLRYALKYGLVESFSGVDANDNPMAVSVLEYIRQDLLRDSVEFTNADIAATFNEALTVAAGDWEADRNREMTQIDARISAMRAERSEEIRRSGGTMDRLERLDREMEENLAAERRRMIDEFAAGYISQTLLSHPDDVIRELTTELVSEKYTLSKVHTKYSKIETELDRLTDFVPRALYELKDAVIGWQLREVREQIRALSASENMDFDRLRELMERNAWLQQLKAQFAPFIGERVIVGRK